ncbi:oxygenase MpaB family protein [[Mycobacterium] wendilense]|uniref:Oxygenase MpaB family protein n=1 Tax=[Mycobacterium] wendilense TaxID=3064284 RepID=A0ABN9P701_9MYCO|nr:oxygenase MpaB family protein [Mycolicibacterium sp. MU0050]CAJ1585503.1 oxygenase MpaB family protein [Mycolicibacterium sp. MU0050]
MTDNRFRGYIGDRRLRFMLPRAVCLQLLHPAIAAGIWEHALLRERIWQHKKRTVTASIDIAFTDNDMRSVIRFGHEHVKGRTADGAKYHALDPEIFHFQHATYVESIVAMVNSFIRPLNDDEHEQLYQQCCDWYRRYGISARALPPDWPSFQEYFQNYCDAELCAGEHFERFRDEIFAPSDWWPARVPRSAIRAMQHAKAIELTGVQPSAADRRALRTFAAACRVGAVIPALWAPAKVRKHRKSPGVSAGDARARE